MSLQKKNINRKKTAALAGAMMLSAMAIPAAFAADEQETFQSPQAAVDALIDANRQGDTDGLLKILGPDGKKIISSGDAVADKTWRDKFVAAYDDAHKLETENDGTEILIVGDKEWPMPIPLVQQNGAWQFDTAAGEEEILNRRIGRNELNVIETCRAYVEAQREFADGHVLKNGQHEYAARFVSHDGMHDGLYWPVADSEQESPLGPMIAFAEAVDPNTGNGAEPYHGYYYKILSGQTQSAPGGAMSYVSHGHMTGGFALIAFPAQYGDSGIMTFMVDQDGIVLEKDLGPNTAKIARKIAKYNPDNSWNVPQY